MLCYHMLMLTVRTRQLSWVGRNYQVRIVNKKAIEIKAITQELWQNNNGEIDQSFINFQAFATVKLPTPFQVVLEFIL